MKSPDNFRSQYRSGAAHVGRLTRAELAAMRDEDRPSTTLERAITAALLPLSLSALWEVPGE